jgi:UDPglucose 6-dehydrogenase
LKGKKIAVLGLSFKPNTDDMREAPSITILSELAGQGASLCVFDPIAFKEAKWRLAHIESALTYCDDEYSTMVDADALVILTEWNQFRNLNLDKVKMLLKQPYFFDFRNIYKRLGMEEKGFIYTGVGI